MEVPMSPPCIARAFGERLRRERIEAGLTQQQVAERAEMDPAEISRYEKGVRSPRLNTVVRLADALEISPSILVQTDESEALEADIAAVVALLRCRSYDQVHRVREVVELLLTT